MGLASALNTALTGLNGSETSIDVIGNNLANANTVGFKESQASFATQFLQTQNYGTAPTTDNGGTNPMQTGLGTTVQAILTNFSQGTVQVSSNPTDMAIQGNGFFVVQGSDGAQYYTRDGETQLNSTDQLTTAGGYQVMGLQATDGALGITLSPLTISLGTATAAAVATKNASLEGQLSPSGTLGTLGEILQSSTLGDAQYTRPTSTATATAVATVPSAPTLQSTDDSAPSGAGLTGGSTYYYEAVGYDPTTGTQGLASSPLEVNLASGDDEVNLSNLSAGSSYSDVQIYRTVAGGTANGPYYLVGTQSASTTTFTDNTSDASITANPTTYTELKQGTLSGEYTYYVTYVNSQTGIESRPSDATSVAVTDGLVQLSNLPIPAAGNANDYDEIRIYRNTAGGSSFYQVGQLSTSSLTSSTVFTDDTPDSTLTSETSPHTLNFNGPGITDSTLLSNLITNPTGTEYSYVFPNSGTLSFTGQTGGENDATQTLTVNSASNVLDLCSFLQGSLGINMSGAKDQSGALGASVDTSDSTIQVVSNPGTANAITIPVSALQFTNSSGTSTVNLTFSSTQAAAGTSASTNFVVYDSLGESIPIQLNMVLQDTANKQITYEWYATSGENTPSSGNVNTTVGTGTVTFSDTGSYLSSTGSVTVYPSDKAAASPLNFNLNFAQMSAVATSDGTVQLSSQDGIPSGTLTSYTIGSDGLITGVFSNGSTQTLGQIQLAQFTNPAGLVQQGQNLYSAGVNAGEVHTNNPGSNGAGTIVSGATELSNSDIGTNLVDLILASTMYRGNSEVITTVQTLFDTLLQVMQTP